MIKTKKSPHLKSSILPYEIKLDHHTRDHLDFCVHWQLEYYINQDFRRRGHRALIPKNIPMARTPPKLLLYRVKVITGT